MEAIIPIKGNVRYAITMDPSIWIFDDRRIDLETFFTSDHVEVDELEEYKRKMGKHWSREIMEGATFPPTLETEKQFEENKVITGTYGIYLSHFLKNAELNEDAHTLIIETSLGEGLAVPIEKADELILKFCNDGKPLKEDGPVHIVFKDGSNIQNPIRNVAAIKIE